MIQYEYNSEMGIVEAVYTGDIHVSDLIAYGDKIYADQSLPRKLLVLTDVTKANYVYSTKEFEELMENLKRHLTAYKFIKVAFIQSKPKETAYSMLVTKMNPSPNYVRGVFSTREAALKWLLSKI